MPETQHINDNEKKLESIRGFLTLWENYHEIYAELVSDYEELIARASGCSGNYVIRKPKPLGKEEYRPDWSSFLLVPNFDEVCAYFINNVTYRRIWSMQEVVFEESVIFLLRNMGAKCAEFRRFLKWQAYDPERFAYAIPPEFCGCGRHYGGGEGAYPSDER